MINVIYNNKLDLISNTPLVYLNNISKEYNCNIYLKLEKYNLTGSSKDRAVKEMLLFALNNKIINSNSTIIEATSGNTGISLACICSLLKLKCIIVMPINSNKERIKLIKLFNASIVFTSKEGKMKESVNKSKALNKSIENSFILSQFDNYNNIIANYKIADEIIKDLPNIDFLIRTSNEKRLSNFMLWQASYAELYFTKTLWPAFTKRCLIKALKDYSKRDRRFGGVKK